ncbi:MAG: carboxypeptidase-like regulatory domain-containing protein [Saprospiraceae bacterium]|nr:carboxypeptidase-like regulatory domain-containing protein [Saprospiraceae bacterium]
MFNSGVRWIILLTLLMLGIGVTSAQEQDSSIVQFSGLVVTGDDAGDLMPLPFANILLSGSGRGTFSNLDGFFSIVARKGERVVFSSVGYGTVEFTIPDTLKDNRYTIYQIMTQDTFTLPETVVYPWPSREHFKIEFLALEVPDDLQRRAEENLEANTMLKMRENLDTDGGENTGYYLRKQAESYYSIGQSKPMHILNPIAWSKFFKDWKAGKFKRKGKK